MSSHDNGRLGSLLGALLGCGTSLEECQSRERGREMQGKPDALGIHAPPALGQSLALVYGPLRRK